MQQKSGCEVSTPVKIDFVPCISFGINSQLFDRPGFSQVSGVEMIITVQGTPEECEALCDVLKDVQLSSEVPIAINVIVQATTRPSLMLIQGGKTESSADDRRKIELPLLPR